MPFKDTHGLKLYNTAVAQKYEKQTISSSSIFDEELIYRVYKSGHNIKEIGVSVHEIRPARTGILSRAFEVIINLYNLIVFIISVNFFSNSQIQVLLILLNISIYTFIYFKLFTLRYKRL